MGCCDCWGESRMAPGSLDHRKRTSDSGLKAPSTPKAPVHRVRMRWAGRCSRRGNHVDMNKKTAYEDCQGEIAAIWSDEGGATLDDISLMATINSVLSQHFPHFYWTGFYRFGGVLTRRHGGFVKATSRVRRTRVTRAGPESRSTPCAPRPTSC